MGNEAKKYWIGTVELTASVTLHFEEDEIEAKDIEGAKDEMYEAAYSALLEGSFDIDDVSYRNLQEFVEEELDAPDKQTP